MIPARPDLAAVWDTLYAHQKHGVRWMLAVNRCIVADDMGLGKTRQSLVAARILSETHGVPVFVIAPASLLDNWKREADAVAVEVSVHSWAKVPSEIAPGSILICDEAHYAQNLKSARTRAILALRRAASSVFLLTGTPMKNGKPINLLPLLGLIDHPLAQRKRDFELTYCAAKLREMKKRMPDGSLRLIRRFWDNGGASNLVELHEKIKPVMLRRLKRDCLDLPKKTRIKRKVDLTRKEIEIFESEYEEAFIEYERRKAAKKAMIEAALEFGEMLIADADGDEETIYHVGQALKDIDRDLDLADAIVALTRIRKAASAAKIETAAAMIEELLEQGNQVVFFAEFLDTVKTLAARFGITPLIGETTDRQQLVDDFQAGKTRVFGATTGAGGVGITLTAAADVILIDRPLTPGDAEQAEDRCNRIGQTRPVTTYWLQAFESDECVDAILEDKTKAINSVLNGDRETMRGTGSLSPERILRSIKAMKQQL